MYLSTPNFYAKHKGFSLLELIIVVLIISLMGFILFSSAIKEQQKRDISDPTTLSLTLRDSFKGEGDIELFCINKCKNCYIMKEDGEISPYEGNINLGENVEVHILDKNNHFIQIDEIGRIDDKKVCLRYQLYANGSTTKMVILNSQGIYYLPSYFGKAQKVKDMEEAKELWIKEEYSLRDSGSFY